MEPSNAENLGHGPSPAIPSMIQSASGPDQVYHFLQAAFEDVLPVIGIELGTAGARFGGIALIEPAAQFGQKRMAAQLEQIAVLQPAQALVGHVATRKQFAMALNHGVAP